MTPEHLQPQTWWSRQINNRTLDSCACEVLGVTDNPGKVVRRLGEFFEQEEDGSWVKMGPREIAAFQAKLRERQKQDGLSVLKTMESLSKIFPGIVPVMGTLLSGQIELLTP